MDAATRAAINEKAYLRSRLGELERRTAEVTRARPASERDELSAAQSRADSVAARFGKSVSPPIPGERPLDYRRRLLTQFQPHSSRFRHARLDSLDAPTLAAVEAMIFEDAVAAAKRPESYPAGSLTPVMTRENGRDVTRFVGDPMAWMGAFTLPGAIGRFNREPGKR